VSINLDRLNKQSETASIVGAIYGITPNFWRGEVISQHDSDRGTIIAEVIGPTLDVTKHRAQLFASIPSFIAICRDIIEDWKIVTSPGAAFEGYPDTPLVIQAKDVLNKAGVAYEASNG
jgi:hypothetical protein